MGSGASFLAGGMAYDALLEEAGRDKQFLPFMCKMCTGVFGYVPKIPANNSTSTLVTEQTKLLIKKKLKPLQKW